MALHFGTESKQENVKRFTFRMSNEVLNITASTQKGNCGLLIIIGQIMEPNPHIVEGVTGDDGLPCSIFIDSRVTSDLLHQIIVASDTQAGANGGIKDGKRVDLGIVAEPPKLRVDDIFVQPGASIPILPEPNDTKEMLMMRAKQMIVSFDKPNELALLDHAISGISIIRHSDLDYIKERERVVNAVLEEKCIDPNKLSELPQEAVIELRKQIDVRLKAALESGNTDE
jgi:hypothetical protein